MAAQHVSFVELCEILGKDAATCLCRHRGGGYVSVPMNHDRGDLSPLLGTIATKSLCAAFGGSIIKLPNHVNKPRPEKGRILFLLTQGWSIAKIARECRVTTRWVEMVKYQARRRQVIRNLPLAPPE